MQTDAMKTAEVPKGAMIAIAVVVVAIVGYFAYASFAKPPAQVDPTTVSADRLLDPDRRGAKAP